MPSVAFLLLACGSLLAAGCSPVFNWREVPLDDALMALLPCKPDRASRPMPLGEAQVSLDMAGCEAGGATFAVARLPAGDDAGQARLRAEAWRAAARRPWAGAVLAEAPVQVPGAAAEPAPVELRAEPPPGADPARRVRMRWFAHADARGRLTLYQATVLGTPRDREAEAAFFDGLQWR